MKGWTEAMKNVIAGELHVVVAERQDQVTGVFWTRNPQQQLANISCTTQIGRVDVRPCARAARLVNGLADRFEASITARNVERFWSAADFEEIIAALEEYDLETGALKERAGIKLHDAVYVTNLGRGVVTGFSNTGRIMVRLDRPKAHAQACAIAPRSCVKPILRAGTA
jgi:hypothetical protein